MRAEIQEVVKVIRDGNRLLTMDQAEQRIVYFLIQREFPIRKGEGENKVAQ
jgi:hypothetical protein